MARLRLPAFAALAMLLTRAGPAPAEADPSATAEALFRSGRAAAARGDFALACKRFYESQRMQPAAGTLLNLGVCEEQQGRLAEAWQNYHAALDALPDPDPRSDLARRRIAGLEPRLPRFRIRVAAGSPPHVQVRLGEVTLTESSFDVFIPVNPGRHTWFVSAPGYQTREYVQTVAESERVVLTVAPGPSSTKTTAPPRPLSPVPTTRSAPAPVLGYVLLASGAASLVASGVTALMAVQRGKTVDAECEGRDCTRRGLDAADEGRTLVRWCTLSFAVGVLGVGAGSYFVLTANPSPASAAATSKGFKAELHF